MTTSKFDQMFPLGDPNDAFAAYFLRTELPCAVDRGQCPGGQRVVRAGV